METNKTKEKINLYVYKVVINNFSDRQVVTYQKRVNGLQKVYTT